jgi:hypothetical protein
MPAQEKRRALNRRMKQSVIGWMDCAHLLSRLPMNPLTKPHAGAAPVLIALPLVRGVDRVGLAGLCAPSEPALFARSASTTWKIRIETGNKLLKKVLIISILDDSILWRCRC